MPEAGSSGRPHVWNFAGVILAAAIDALATIVVGVQKGRYDESRRDLEGRIQALAAERSRYQNHLDEVSAERNVQILSI